MPYKRVYSLSVAITSVFVYFIWGITAKIEIQQIQNIILHNIIILLMDFILAYGFFKIVLNFIVSIIEKFRIVKRYIFGASYIEGIWVGQYEIDNELFYFVERIEQDLEHINVSGKGYNEDSCCIGTWKSISVCINEKDGTMECIYESDDYEKSVISKGSSYFVFNRKNGKSPPHSLTGYSIEIDNPVKVQANEIKIYELPNKVSERELIEKAKNAYSKS